MPDIRRDSFTTIKNHNTLKRYLVVSEAADGFTTIKNHNTLKLLVFLFLEKTGFTTIKNHNTLKPGASTDYLVPQFYHYQESQHSQTQVV